MPKVDISVGDLVAMIENGELRLPEMQRKYVWTSTRVRDLFDSLYRGYPSGTILVWETQDSRPTRDMAVSQNQSAFSTSRLLLDGQQRLTSLSAVLRGVPVRVRNRQKPIDIAFNLDHPEGAPSDSTEIEDDQEVPTSVGEGETQDDEPTAEETESVVYDRLARRTFAVGFRALFSRPNWILVSDVFKGTVSDWDLLKRLVRGPDDPAFGKYQLRLNKLRKIRDYPYVMQVLDRAMTYEEVTEIFVRVNSLGAKLRSSDLALAQITARWQNSLPVFEEYIERCEENWFTIDMGLLARAMVIFATGQSRFTTVGSLSKEQLQAAWEKTKSGMDYAINFLRSNAGIEDESLLSSAFFDASHCILWG